MSVIRVTGRRPRRLHGRAWWRKWNIEWSVPTHAFRVSFGINGGDNQDTIKISFHCGMFGLYIGRKGLPVNRFGEHRKTYFHREEREFNLSLYDHAFHLTIWGRVMDWHSKDPWWIKGVTWSPTDTLLGKTRHTH